MNAYLQLIIPFGLAAAFSAILCRLLRPLLVKYALARPNARSSHTSPTPQGGGIAVLLGTFGAVAVMILLVDMSASQIRIFGVVAGAGITLGALGAWDDIRPLPALFRLVAQTLIVLAVVILAVPDITLLPAILPSAVERALVILAAVWFINLTNFMDGLDWLTIAAIVPATVTIGLLAQVGYLDSLTGHLALALAGALVGFAPFNRPVARLFLGDVGALPIGLLAAFLLYQLAGSGAFVAALLLPLYSVSDASLTLARRLFRHERVWEAHRSHYYQLATDHGFSPLAVSAHVFGLNVALSVLAVLATWSTRSDVRLLAMFLGLVLTGLLLRRFSRALDRSIRGQP